MIYAVKKNYEIFWGSVGFLCKLLYSYFVLFFIIYSRSFITILKKELSKNKKDKNDIL